MPWVREIFMADVPNVDLLKYQDKLKLFYMKTLDFMESNNLQISKENIVKNADRIKHWDIGSKGTHPSGTDATNEQTVTVEPVIEGNQKADKTIKDGKIAAIEADIFKFKRYGFFAFVILIILIYMKK